MLKSDYILKAKNKRDFDKRMDRAIEKNNVFPIIKFISALESDAFLESLNIEKRYVINVLVDAMLKLKNFKLFVELIRSKTFLFILPERADEVTKAICETQDDDLIMIYFRFTNAFLDEHNLNLLTSVLVKRNDIGLVINTLTCSRNLSEKSNCQITKWICKQFNTFDIYHFVVGMPHIFFSNKVSDIILERLCDMKNEEYIFETARLLEDISDKSKRLVAQALSGSFEYAKKFLLGFNGLECLGNEIVEKMFQVIDLDNLNFRESLILSQKFNKYIETKIRETKNVGLVVAFILVTSNLELLYLVFGTKLAFVNYCLENRQSILLYGYDPDSDKYFDKQLLTILKMGDDFNYVDANMNSFFRESSKSIKKVKEG